MEIIILILSIVGLVELTYLVAVNTNQLTLRNNRRPVFVDTSVLIDGRIIAVAESGFIGGTLSIPRSVVGELQFLADHADSDKRARARYGLDVIAELQQLPDIKVEIFQDGSQAKEGVDERLLKLAKKYKGAICTIDYNLNKVAQVENVPVLNVNDLAMKLRMAYLPGEKILLELTQKGQDAHQAVGHLPDGTMVVVEHASDKIGQTAEVEFIRSLQTAAGKMMFARLVVTDTAKKSAAPFHQIKAAATRDVQTANNKRYNTGSRNNLDRSRRKPYRNKASQTEQNLIQLVEQQPNQSQSNNRNNRY